MTTGRVQLALNVTDFDAAVRLYSDLFATEPSKRRPGYANFAIADPPLKLVLFENPDATAALNHLGVELESTEDVAAAAQRFVDNGLRHSDHAIDRCCHAVQDKIWVDAPDVPLGAWEFYTVLADDAGTGEMDSASTCCTGHDTSEGPCCGPGQGA
jgi:catechol 2,3-dioxygenase-like lactoylglutathione lyase family enzyme